ncbi:hypothetical protein ACFFWB_27365 [Flavobacterium procerum]|uniref:hypothetical protein n=1 Tax=Flavobacterium procerum TaxID=1455569 RepID=UPI0035EDDD45
MVKKTKVFLAGIKEFHQPGFIFLDEPSNHLDLKEDDCYDFIKSTSATFLVVSHDKKVA